MKHLLLYSLVLLMFSGCDFALEHVNGSGNVVTETRDISDFSGIKVTGSMDVVVSISDAYKVQVTTDDNLMQYIMLEKDGDMLVIKQEDGIAISNSKGIHITIQMPSLKQAEVSGSGSVTTLSQVSGSGKFEAAVAGSGKLNLDVNYPDVEVGIAGSGNATFKGMTRKLDLSIAGSGDYYGEQLKSEEAEIAISGSGNANVYASVTLDVSIAGSGDVVYYGSPKISQHIGGSGSVKRGN